MDELGENIWTVDGETVVALMGFHYPTRMVVIRLADGALFLWSPVALTPALHAEVKALGPVTHIVAPNALHHLALADWQAAYPEAQIWAAPGLAAKRDDLRFAGTLGDTPDPAWAGEIDQVHFTNRITDEIVFFHRPSGTAIVTDLIQQMPKDWYRGWRALVAKLDLMTAAAPQVPRKFRTAFSDKAAARAAARKVLAWNANALVVAHGPREETGAARVLNDAFAFLKP